MTTSDDYVPPLLRWRRQGAASWARTGRRRRGTAGGVLLALVGVTLAVSALWPAALVELPAPAAASRIDTVRPVPGEVAAEFDPPEHPYGPGRRGVRFVAAPRETVRAARGGEVVFAAPVAGTPWVSVDHGGGLRTSYGPVEPAVRAGEPIEAGDVLGRLADGEDGLHWGARIEGTYIDPLDLLRSWRPVLVPRAEQPG